MFDGQWIYSFYLQVHMVSHGAQTNGILAGRKLTKSLSEAVGVRKVNANGDVGTPDEEINQ